MKKKSSILLICFIIINITVVSLFFTTSGYCATMQIDSKFGEPPVIDGYLDLSGGEWNKASKVNISMEGLPADLWVMQSDQNLYISIQIELESVARKQTEFIMLMISNSSSENRDDFIDAKIVQFSNISDDKFNFLDYKIINNVFINDTEYDGNGAAKLDGLISTYEFSIPIKNNIRSDEDTTLDFGNSYAFNISYGETPVYPSGVIKSTVVLISIEELSYIPPLFIDVVLYILCIIIFCFIGLLLGFYIYNILRLKKNIEKYKM